MKEVSIHVGQRIRLYRKTKNLTIETFAGMIHKSKATVSKYENGDISIDIETLFTIAQALGVPVNQLIDYEEIGEEKGEKGEIIKHNLSKSKYYMYFYDGRRSRIARNVIEVQDGGEDSGVFSANMYASLEDLSNYYQCKLLYHGTMRKGIPSSISILKTRIIRWSECLCTPSIPLIMAAEWKDFAAAYPRSRFCLPASNF